MIVSGRMSTVVVATPDVVGARMAGPGIRAWNIAREMAKVAPTTLVAKVEGSPRPDSSLSSQLGMTIFEEAGF